MKRLKKILQAIHSLPEETRKFLAGLSFVISVLALATLWNITIPMKLANLQEEPQNNEVIQESAVSLEEDMTLTPTGGIVESFRSLRNLIPNVSMKPQKLEQNLKERAESVFGKMANFLFYD